MALPGRPTQRLNRFHSLKRFADEIRRRPHLAHRLLTIDLSLRTLGLANHARRFSGNACHFTVVALHFHAVSISLPVDPSLFGQLSLALRGTVRRLGQG